MLEGMQQLLFSTTSAFCIGFVSGLLFIFLLAGSIITQSPKRIPTMLTHSGKHGFLKVSKQHVDGVYETSYTIYLKKQQHLRALFLIALCCLCAMIVSVLVFG